MQTIDTTIVAPISDTEAAPLTTAEADALLAQAAGAERKPTVPGEADSRAWAFSGQVD
jgi:hypothetical protein